jgi:hypothetical protein
MSVRAAASFAQSGTTSSALSATRPQGGGGRVGLFVLAVVALLAFGGIGAAVAIRLYSPTPHPKPPAAAPADRADDPPKKPDPTQPL